MISPLRAAGTALAALTLAACYTGGRAPAEAAPAASLGASAGHFVGHLDLRPEDKNHHEVEVTDDGRQVWALTRPLTYRTAAGDTITVPAGMSTDLASIPRWARVALPPDGPWLKAAVIHDFLYRTSGTCRRWKASPSGCSRAAPYSREEADRILDEAMAALGVSAGQRAIIFTAVRLGGASGWGH